MSINQLHHIQAKLVLVLTLAVIFVLSFHGCRFNKPKKISQSSFYYWKSVFNLNSDESDLLKTLHVKQLFVKFFDVKLSEKGNPEIIASLQKSRNAFPEDIQIIPVVFIVNDIFKNIPDGKTHVLAAKIARRIKKIAGKKTFTEYQIDCDWSGSTKDEYFTFLQEIKLLFPNKTLNGTIRLHQIKYRKKTGIPPLDRGTLMVYNLTNPTVYSPTNSIFDSKEVMKYIQNQPMYPLDLDIALPIFSWGLHFSGQRFRGFLNKFTNQHVLKQSYLRFFKENFYRVTKDTVVQGEYLRLGDKIKIEEVKTTDLTTILPLILPITPNDTFRLILFHLDDEIIKNNNHYEIERLFKVCN